MSNRASYFPAAILLAGCVLLARSRDQETMRLAAPLQSVMATYTGYAVKDAQIDAEERRVAGMTDYVARSYLRDTAVAFTTLVSYYDRQAQGRTIHSPKNCLPGAGWEILRAAPTAVPSQGASHTVNRVVLKNRGAVALVYYWYQGRGRVVASEYAVKWNLLRDAALLGHSEEALVRVVVPVANAVSTPGDRSPAVEQADSLARQVTAQLIADVTRVLPKSR